MDYHLNKVREAGASDEEIQRAISDAVSVRDNAKLIIENHGLKQLGLQGDISESCCSSETTRIRELVSIGAAFAVNCTTNLEKHIKVSGTVGVTEDEVKSVLDAAHFIKGEAAHYVGQIARLREEKDQLQQLLEELQQTQAQLVQSEKMAALGKLVAGMVHELNNPLGALQSTNDVTARSVERLMKVLETSETPDDVKGSAELQGPLNALRDNTTVTRSAGDRIASIVSSLRSFIRLDESEFKKVDIHEGLEATLTLIEHDLADRIRIEKHYGAIPPVAVYPGELNQVYMNLLLNAVHAIEGRGTISIKTFLENENVCIEISDTGVGISPDERERLFEPSFRKKGSRVKSSLGLFTSYNIIRKHRGHIHVQSEAGKGSTFTIVFPVNLENVSRERKKAEPDGGGSRCDRLQS